MAGSLRIARIAGIGLYVHWSFLLIVLWVAWSSYSQHPPETRWWGVLDGVAFVLAIFACVTLHEYGHALAARMYGVKTRDITLLPIGGVARLEGIPESPIQEFVIAVAGPLVNVVIAVVLFPIVILSMSGSSGDLEHWMLSSFSLRLLFANVVLVLFNLLPAFPMDGGRVLRALLASFLPYDHATRVATRIGGVMAILFVVGAFVFQNPMLVLAALVVYFAGNGEAAQVMQRYLFKRARVADAMTTRFDVLSPDDSLALANSISLRSGQSDFPVVAGQYLLGILTRRQVIDGLQQDRGAEGVGNCDLELPIVVSPEMTLEAIRDLAQGRKASTFLVVAEQRLVGMLTVDSFNRFMAGVTAGQFSARASSNPANASSASASSSVTSGDRAGGRDSSSTIDTLA